MKQRTKFSEAEIKEGLAMAEKVRRVVKALGLEVRNHASVRRGGRPDTPHRIRFLRI